MRRIVTGTLSAFALLGALYASVGLAFALAAGGDFNQENLGFTVSSLLCGPLSAALAVAAIGVCFRPRRLFVLLPVFAVVTTVAASGLAAIAVFVLATSDAHPAVFYSGGYEPPTNLVPAMLIASSIVLAALSAVAIGVAAGRVLPNRSDRFAAALLVFCCPIPFANVLAVARVGIATIRWTTAETPLRSIPQPDAESMLSARQ
jgi:hypothetical protein